jgi:cell division protein ZapE
MNYTLASSPLTRYMQLIEAGDINFDQSQQTALLALEKIYNELSSGTIHQDNKTSIINVPKVNKTSKVHGLYFWGKVGRGKTFLMDLFAESLNPEYCLRIHFHHFLKSIHQQLNQYSGQAEPLKIIAKKFSQQYKVLCFDEFFVSDIGDAMLLGKLCQYLFTYNITLVCTSNIEPENLYRNGLQRERFLPAIKAIIDNTDTIELIGLQDHRERQLHPLQIYFIQDENDLSSQENFATLCQELSLPITFSQKQTHKALKVMGREIPYLAGNNHKTDAAIAFNFSDICQGPRSHFDYIEIAKTFKHIIITHLPQLSGISYERIKARGTEDGSIGSGETGEREVVLAPMDDATRRFIALVDEFYERKVKLFLTSETPLLHLYKQGSLLFEFERTRSRLTEMASQEYQQLAYIPVPLKDA